MSLQSFQRVHNEIRRRWIIHRLSKIERPRILSVRELEFPFLQFEIDYTNTYLKLAHKELGGLYEFSNLILHTATGTLLYRSRDNTRLTVIREGNVEDIEDRLTYDPAYLNLARCMPSNSTTRSFGKPVFVFDVLKRKSNYYHFITDNVLRLLCALEHFKQPLVLLHPPGIPDFGYRLLQLVAEVYDCDLVEYPIDEQVRIASSVIIIDAPLKRFYWDFPSYVRSTHQRILDEGVDGFSKTELEGAQPGPSKYNLSKWWYVRRGDKVERLLNDSIMVLPSRTGGSAMTEFVKKLSHLWDFPWGGSDIVFIDRQDTARSSKEIENIDVLLKRRPDVRGVVFGQLDMSDQVKIAMRASILIGSNGAGLTNSLFMKPGSSVVNIHPRNFFVPSSNMFGVQCGIRDVNYHTFESAPTHNKERSTIIDVDALCELIDAVKQM